MPREAERQTVGECGSVGWGREPTARHIEYGEVVACFRGSEALGNAICLLLFLLQNGDTPPFPEHIYLGLDCIRLLVVELVAFEIQAVQQNEGEGQLVVGSPPHHLLRAALLFPLHLPTHAGGAEDSKVLHLVLANSRFYQRDHTVSAIFGIASITGDIHSPHLQNFLVHLVIPPIYGDLQNGVVVFRAVRRGVPFPCRW